MEILTPHISCVVTEAELNDAIAQKYGEIYILSGNGIFKHMRLKADRYVRFLVSSIPNYKSALSEEMNFLPAGKIPYDMFEQLIQFFKSVMTVKKCDLEAMAHILWSPEEGYHISVPNQTISKASVSYDWEGYLKPNDIIVLDIHSHNTMGAFFSGTDNSDDKKGLYYSGVVGQLNNPTPALVWRFNINEVKRDATLGEIFEVPHKEVTINNEWLDKVKTGGQVVPFHGPTKHIGSGGRYLEQSKFPGFGGFGNNFDEYGDVDFWRHRGVPSESEANSEKDPKAKSVPGIVYPSGWNTLAEVKEELEEKRGMAQAKKRGKDSSPGENDYHIAQYGEELTDAKDNAEIWIDDLEACDDLLHEIIMYAYDKLSESGQMKLMTEGF